MGRQDEIVAERLKKLKQLRADGINPYPNSFDATTNAHELQTLHAKLKHEASVKGTVKLAGRLMGVRDMGKIAFGTLYDGTGTIQIVLQEKDTPEKTRTFFKDSIDSGDFVGAEGTVFRTKRGELSVAVKKITLLTKSILPLPDKFHGLADDEERLRKRYLEIITNSETRELFVRKSRFWSTIRTFLIERGFLEVETPVLENSAGGASATPFQTHHNALNLDVFLRISMGELWQKKLMVAGYPKTFEIGRQFRNEGMDAEHLQDYTQMEFYWGYANYEDGMKLVEEMYKTAAKATYGKTKFSYAGHQFDLGGKWKIIDYADSVKKELGIDIFNASKEEMEKKLRSLGQMIEPHLEKGRLIDLLWKVCRKKISGPVFLTGQPVEVSPLAKRNPQDPRKVEQFQIIIAGTEIGNGYSELNDPFDQEARFAEQRRMKEAGDVEAQEHDEGFVEALKYGMPPTCGFGVSERLFAVLENKPIRECVIFPLMRPPMSVSKADKIEVKKGEKKGVATCLPMPRDDAWKLVKKHNTDRADLNHYLESEAVMRGLAEHLGEDVEYWGMLGLVHDVDWGITKHDARTHLTKAPTLLSEAGFPREFIETIVSHGYGFDCAGLLDKKRSQRIEHALAAAETVTGLIHSYALMRKGIAGMDVAGLKKKFKDKKFAAAVRRDVIEECKHLGLELDTFLQIAIRAISTISKEVGL